MSKETQNIELSTNKALNIADVSSRFVNVKLRRDTAEGMISTYEFLVWNNDGEEKKECQRILKALKKTLS
jgi:hypothetical protein